MHRWMYLDELRASLCQHFDTYRREDWSNLLHLALTNKLWFDSSMDAMWRNVCTREHVRLLFERINSPVDPSVGLATKDMATFESYAGRVRTLSLWDSWLEGIPVGSLGDINCFYKGNHSPFIRLNVLVAKGNDSETTKGNIVTVLEIMLSQSVQSLEICVPGTPPVVQDDDSILTELLNTRAPNVKTMKLMPYDSGNGFDNILFSLQPTSFKALRSLRLDFWHVGQRELDFMASFPSLTFFGLWDNGKAAGKMLSWPPNSFAKLTEMELSSLNVNRLAHLLSLDSGPAVQSLTSYFTFSDSRLSVHPVLSALASIRWNSIKILDIRVRIASVVPSADVPFGTWSDISPLLVLPLIEDIKFRHDGGVNLTKSEVRDALKSWAHLRRFHISYTNEPEHYDIPVMKDPQLGIDILDAFAELCPLIEKIGLAFNDSPPVQPFRFDLPSLSRLQELDITLSMGIKSVASCDYLSRRVRHPFTLLNAGHDIWAGNPPTGPQLDRSNFPLSNGWPEMGIDLPGWMKRLS